MQGKTLARLAVGNRRWHLQALECLGAGAGLAEVGTNEIAGKQRVDPGNAAGTNAWAHHPELGVFAGEVVSLLDQADGGGNAFLILTQLHRGDMTDDHIAVLDLGLVGGQPFAGLEGNLDSRPLLQPVVYNQ
ncbi:hypothetical protein D3C77_533750 [compost metagenome]